MSTKRFHIAGVSDIYIPDLDTSSDPFVDGGGAEIVIYARTTGSDVHGDGSLANPFRTFVHATAVAAERYPFYHNLYVTVDITGLGTENLPDGYVLPPFYASTPTKFDFVAPDQLDTRREAFNVVAHSVGAVDTILAGDIVAQTYDPTSKIGTITLGPGHPLVPGALVGKFVRTTVFGFIAVLAPISKNTATTIEVTSNFFSFVSFDAPLLIVQPSAELRNNNPASDLDAIRIHGWGSVLFAGVKISHANVASQPVAIQCEGSVDLAITGCDLAGIVPGDSQSVASTVEIDNSYIHDKTLDQHFYSMEVFGCFLKDVGSGNAVGQGVTSGVVAYVSNVHENHANLSCGGVEGTPGGGLSMRECIVRGHAAGGLVDAVSLVAVGNLVLTEITCRDNAGSAIGALRPGYAKLTTVRGFNNSGWGVIANKHSCVDVTPDTDVTGPLTDTVKTGVAASVVAGAPANSLRISGLAGMGAGDVGNYLKLTGAGYEIHNDTFLILSVIDAATVLVLMNGITTPLDASNGAINWIVRSGGADLRVGAMPVRTWSDFRTNAPLRNQFDVPGFPGATAATATGAQVKEG